MAAEHDATIDATIAAAASKATQVGAGTSVISWFMSSEFGVIFGVVLGIGGLAINWYYKHKEDKRREAEHQRRMGLYE